METRKKPEGQWGEDASKKKPYRKPAIQIYGTLSQLTQNQTNPAANVLDGGAPNPPANPTNRT
jgi:hypothetical protein